MTSNIWFKVDSHLATHTPHTEQCFVRSGLRFKHVTQNRLGSGPSFEVAGTGSLVEVGKLSCCFKYSHAAKVSDGFLLFLNTNAAAH
eukprot:17760-Heterococcus_DN1.PRE.4